MNATNENFDTVYKVHGYKSCDGTITHVTLYRKVPTIADAEKLAAEFPKTYKVRGGGLSGLDRDGKFCSVGYVNLTVYLWADGVNKGTNESGLARIRKALRKIGTGGFEYVEAYAQNAASPAELAALLGV
jgi:hypothetical protein